QFEMLLLEEEATNDWWVMLRPGKRARAGTEIILRDSRKKTVPIRATVIETNQEGHRRVKFSGASNVIDIIDGLGEVPLPPYIKRADSTGTEMDRERYQTVFAKPRGSVAAPTAGLHFTEELLDQIRSMGVEICFLTLHVGLGTFAPVKSERLGDH